MYTLINKFMNFYLDGFKNLSPHSKTLWVIILFKLFIMFFVLKLFFFRDTLKNQYETEKEISNHIINQITNTKENTNGSH